MTSTFQYLKGAIRSSENAVFPIDVEPNFQYLKGAIRSDATTYTLSFWGSFQYLKGAIRRISDLSIPDFCATLSIPQGCD